MRVPESGKSSILEYSMIATLRGNVVSKTPDIVIECAGVGYGVVVPLLDLSNIKLNQETKLFIYEHIKEDSHNLYGFLNQDTKQLFELLLSVKNVGPKVALAVLDLGTMQYVSQIISSGDVKVLQTAKGVGKRAAEQIVVELRDKVGLPVGDAAEQLVTRSGLDKKDEALQALIALGYSDYDAGLALENVDKTLSVEERVKLALKGGM